MKSLGLSNLFYAMDVINIKQEHINAVNAIIRDFIWDTHACNVDHKICVLPRELGGIGLPDLEIIKKVKRIKMLINILNAKSDELWSIIPKKALKCLDNKWVII